jgi:hypothetical protein
MKLIPSPFVFALAFSLPSLAYFGPARGVRKIGPPQGSIEVPLNPQDPDPIASLPNGTEANANDLHFELSPATPGLKKEDVKVWDANGKDMGWGEPVAKGGGKYEMTLKPGGSLIPKGGGANLFLQSKTKKGWNRVWYSLTLNGKTLYPAKAMADLPVTLLTGNRFPVGLRALTKIENVGSLAITQLQLSLDTTQSFNEVGSDRPGFGIPADGTFVFEEPILPGEKVDLFWSYDAFANNPLHDTEVTITPVTEAEVLSVQAPAAGGNRKAQAKKQLRSWKLEDRAVLLPTLKVLVLDRKKKEAVFMHRGNYAFQIQGLSVRLLKGSAKLGRPFLDEAGNLVVPFSGTTKTFELEISGLVARFGPKAEKGLVKIYLRGKKADQRPRLGYRR